MHLILHWHKGETDKRIETRFLDRHKPYWGKCQTTPKVASNPAMPGCPNVSPNKAVRRKAVLTRLEKTLDAEDPRLKMVTIEAGRAAGTAAAFKQRAIRLKRKPRLGEKDWMVSGTVRNKNGRAAAGVIVQVHDKDFKFVDLLGKTKTDTFGDFHMVYDTCRFEDEWGSEQPDLFLQVLSKEGKVLEAPKEPLNVKAGSISYVTLADLPA